MLRLSAVFEVCGQKNTNICNKTPNLEEKNTTKKAPHTYAYQNQGICSTREKQTTNQRERDTAEKLKGF